MEDLGWRRRRGDQSAVSKCSPIVCISWLNASFPRPPRAPPTKEHSLWKEPEFSNDLKANKRKHECSLLMPHEQRSDWVYLANVVVLLQCSLRPRKMEPSTSDTTALKGDRLDRTAATRDRKAGPMKMKVVSPDQKLLTGCEPAFSKVAINRDRRAARCVT
jgi:hypothetical protein